MSQLILAIGGNEGDVYTTFLHVLEQIEKHVGHIQKKSSLYITEPWGVVDQKNYLNQVVAIDTTLSPQQILAHCLAIERKLGRIRHKSKKWSSRPIDLDILFLEQKIIHTSSLQIPHPRITERNFVLIPLKEILPNFIHPVLNKTIEELQNACNDTLSVKQLK